MFVCVNILENFAKISSVMGCTVARQVTPKLSKTTHLDLKALMNEEYISANHTRIIKKTWNKLSRNIPGIGAKILLRIFELLKIQSSKRRFHLKT